MAPLSRAPVRLGLAVWTLAAILAGCRSRDTGSGEVEFAIAVARMPGHMRAEMAPDLGAADTLRRRLPGQVFDPPRQTRVTSKDSVDRSSLLGAVDADFSAFKAEDDAWIVETFALGERSEIAMFLADSEIREGSRRLFREIERQDALAAVELRTDSAKYAFVFVRHVPPSRRDVVNTYVWEEGEWRRTNEFLRDPTSRFLNLVFRSGWMQSAP